MVGNVLDNAAECADFEPAMTRNSDVMFAAPSESDVAGCLPVSSLRIQADPVIWTAPLYRYPWAASHGQYLVSHEVESG